MIRPNQLAKPAGWRRLLRHALRSAGHPNPRALLRIADDVWKATLDDAPDVTTMIAEPAVEPCTAVDGSGKPELRKRLRELVDDRDALAERAASAAMRADRLAEQLDATENRLADAKRRIAYLTARIAETGVAVPADDAPTERRPFGSFAELLAAAQDGCAGLALGPHLEGVASRLDGTSGPRAGLPVAGTCCAHSTRTRAPSGPRATRVAGSPHGCVISPASCASTAPSTGSPNRSSPPGSPEWSIPPRGSGPPGPFRYPRTCRHPGGRTSPRTSASIGAAASRLGCTTSTMSTGRPPRCTSATSARTCRAPHQLACHAVSSRRPAGFRGSPARCGSGRCPRPP